MLILDDNTLDDNADMLRRILFSYLIEGICTCTAFNAFWWRNCREAECEAINFAVSRFESVVSTQSVRSSDLELTNKMLPEHQPIDIQSISYCPDLVIIYINSIHFLELAVNLVKTNLVSSHIYMYTMVNMTLCDRNSYGEKTKSRAHIQS